MTKIPRQEQALTFTTLILFNLLANTTRTAKTSNALELISVSSDKLRLAVNN